MRWWLLVSSVFIAFFVFEGFLCRSPLDVPPLAYSIGTRRWIHTEKGRQFSTFLTRVSKKWHLTPTPQARLGARVPAVGLRRGPERSVLALPSAPPPHGLSPLLANSDPARLYVIVGDQAHWAAYISEEYFHLFAHLQNTFGWRIVGEKEGESGAELAARCVRELGRAPDVLLFMGVGGPRAAAGEAARVYALLVAVRIAAELLPGTALWLFIDDLHFFDEVGKQRKLAGIRAADLVLGAYMYSLDDFYPEAAGVPRALIPHAASSVFQLSMRPASEVTRTHVFLSGSTEAKWYPYRAMIEERIKKGDVRFAQLSHPGYHKDAPGRVVGSSYAAMLNSHLACITDGLTFDYAVGKIFEIPAAGCLLLVNNEMAPHLLPLGFAPGVHYLTYTAETLDELVDAVLDARNEEAVDAIRAQGQALVWSRHTITHRAAAVHEYAGSPFYSGDHQANNLVDDKEIRRT